MSAAVELRQVSKTYGELKVVHSVDLKIEPGEFTVFVGPSGSGKSTLLRMIAGLEEITGGTLIIDGAEVNEVAPADRGIAMVFQSYALYPHMSVYKNLAFGLETARAPKAEIEARVRHAADILQIGPLLQRKPRQLSGGQRQRVAIGRAIVREPKIFLFDEPLSNLDAELRVQMRVEIAKLHRKLGSTMIYVTHDQVEAMTMADKIVVLRGGVIEQVGSPLELYNHPKNQFVAGFIGSPKMNFLRLKSPLQENSSAAASSNAGQKHTLAESLGIRPEHLVIDSVPGFSSLGSAVVDLVENLGGQTVVYATLTDGQALTVLLNGQCKVGETIDLYFDPAHAHHFSADGERVLQKDHHPA